MHKWSRPSCHIVLRESQIISKNYFSSSPKEQPWILLSEIKTESLAYKRNFGLTKWRAPLLVKTQVTWSARFFSILGRHYWISFGQWINVKIWTTDVHFTYLKVVFVLPLEEIVKIQWGSSSTAWEFSTKVRHVSWSGFNLHSEDNMWSTQSQSQSGI